MNDFEVHPVGTGEKLKRISPIRLKACRARDLARAAIAAIPDPRERQLQERGGIAEEMADCYGAIAATDQSEVVEALTTAVAALGLVNVRCFDRLESPLKPIGDIAREALWNISRTLGDEAYDKVADAALAKHGEKS